MTAVSKGGCISGSACQIFVQQDLSYPSLAAGAQHAIKILVSGNTSSHFVGIKPGQKVDIDGFARRLILPGFNELLVQVNVQLPGCAKVTGAGDAQPVTALLSDLTIDAYENTLGPLFVKVNTVSGKPQLPDETFALWNTGEPFSDGGVEEIVSLSPYFMAGGAFTGFQAANQGHTHDFTSVTGVFGLFIPQNLGIKYKEIYPRVEAEYPIAVIH